MSEKPKTRTLDELIQVRKETQHTSNRWRISADEAILIYKADANLEGADLRGADLRGADLRGADLGGADLGGADLEGADLRGANLRGADLRGVDLQGAGLWGADLQGADLGKGRYIRQLSPIGSSKSHLIIIWDKGDITIQRGCFSGDLEAFKKAVAKKPEGDPHRLEYEAVIVYLETIFAQWQAAMESEKMSNET